MALTKKFIILFTLILLLSGCAGKRAVRLMRGNYEQAIPYALAYNLNIQEEKIIQRLKKEHTTATTLNKLDDLKSLLLQLQDNEYQRIVTILDRFDTGMVYAFVLSLPERSSAIIRSQAERKVLYELLMLQIRNNFFSGAIQTAQKNYPESRIPQNWQIELDNSEIEFYGLCGRKLSPIPETLQGNSIRKIPPLKNLIELTLSQSNNLLPHENSQICESALKIINLCLPETPDYRSEIKFLESIFRFPGMLQINYYENTVVKERILKLFAATAFGMELRLAEKYFQSCKAVYLELAKTKSPNFSEFVKRKNAEFDYFRSYLLLKSLTKSAPFDDFSLSEMPTQSPIDRIQLLLLERNLIDIIDVNHNQETP